MGHRSWIITTMTVAMLKTFFLLSDATRNASFDENYNVTWGHHHVSFLNQKREVQLMLDKSSGFNSKILYFPKVIILTSVSFYLDSLFTVVYY